MHKSSLLIFALFLGNFLIFNLCNSFGEDYEKSLSLVLDSAEKFFISLEEGDFETAWAILSETSRKTIISDVYKASKKIRKDIKKEDIIDDFKNRGMMFKNYWNAFSGNFNSGIILQESRWEIGYIKKNRAEIIITYRKSDHPAKLRMFKEGNAWRVGLVETFWTRKYL